MLKDFCSGRWSCWGSPAPGTVAELGGVLRPPGAAAEAAQHHLVTARQCRAPGCVQHAAGLLSGRLYLGATSIPPRCFHRTTLLLCAGPS